ncbi:hypothetical protein BUALT_Bualt18G0097300 [Buddleja alternifolia]|uniref:Uncharacterized protein n=1 Tax=Buddleja alternifolia TaxID=168488 RepID=A0AAV6WA12_9LAMI|nr:hypothetical protein BUALT_Bualt18G0097300 [Buddleja alternifolia]
MEGVGARLGRSSTRYVPTTVFTGPVRKWKKKWVHAPPSNHHNRTASNGAVNGTNGSSHLFLYKWTPIAPTQTNDTDSNDNDNADAKNDVASEEPPKRKLKYIPIIVLEEQNNESSEQMEDETKLVETDTDTTEATSKSDEFDEKPDINDVPMEENEAPENNPIEMQDLNVSMLDSSLGLETRDGENEYDSKADQTKDD